MYCLLHWSERFEAEGALLTVSEARNSRHHFDDGTQDITISYQFILAEIKTFIICVFVHGWLTKHVEEYMSPSFSMVDSY
jgi:hypothetical protein